MQGVTSKLISSHKEWTSSKDDPDNPLVKIDFSEESKAMLNGQEINVAKEMIRAGIETLNGSTMDLDEFVENQKGNQVKKPEIVH